jgi:tripartite-type tricarboxylate transporter receptor subunit TctC
VTAFVRNLIRFCCLFALTTTAAAQSYPTKTITIVVGVAPGGITDVLARLLANRLSEAWGKPVLVENKPGGNSALAAEMVGRAAPDGHTLFLTPERTFVINPILYRKLPYDAFNGFVPISSLIRAHHVMVVNASLPVSNLQDFLRLAKEKRTDLNYGAWGPGSSAHLSGESLQSLSGTSLAAVHYKGPMQALNDVMAGHIQMMFMDAGNVVEPAKAGKLKLLGTASRERMKELPDLPAIAETLPGFESAPWWGLFAPRGVPSDVAAKIDAEVRKVLADPKVQSQFMAPQYLEVFDSTPAAMQELIIAERAKWAKVIEAAKIKID